MDGIKGRVKIRVIAIKNRGAVFNRPPVGLTRLPA